MKPTIFHLADAGQGDLSAGVSNLCREFGVPMEAEPRLHDTIAHCAAERFLQPYDAGAQLALKRPHGPEMRRTIARPDLTPKLLVSFDHLTCDEAGFLEMTDRYGVMGMIEFVMASAETSDGVVVSPPHTRVAPVAHEHILPFVREAVAAFLNDEIGMKASKRRDFKKKKGKLTVVPGRMADFIQRALILARWDFTAEEIAENYGILLQDRPWNRHPRPRRRSATAAKWEMTK
jgi:hypothetical protein